MRSRLLVNGAGPAYETCKRGRSVRLRPGGTRMTTHRQPSLATALAGWLLCGVDFSVIAGLAAAPATAQTAGPAAAASANNGEVVVTAERRATNVQRTAIPVTVFTGADLARKAIYSVDDLQFTTPN